MLDCYCHVLEVKWLDEKAHVYQNVTDISGAVKDDVFCKGFKMLEYLELEGMIVEIVSQSQASHGIIP